MIRRFLFLALALVAALPAEDLGPGPVPTNTTLLAPGPIGSTTPSTGAFTTLSATGAITSTLAQGSAPLVVASTTAVANLNASLLLGNTWAAPGTIGSGTPSTGAFSTLTASGKTAVAASGLSAFGIFDVGEGGTNPLTGTTQEAVRSFITSTSAATAGTYSVVGVASTAASAYTCGFAVGGYFAFGTLGAGSTVTRAAGLYAERATSGTNMAGLVIIDAGGSPAWTGTLAIDNESTQPSLFAGGLTSKHATSGIGYSAGAGGTVTQLTSKATAVSLSTVCGTITLNNAALASVTSVAFTWTDTAIAANDVVVCVHDSVGTLGGYGIVVTPGAGSATVTVRNNTAGSLSEAIVLRFAVIKAATN